MDAMKQTSLDAGYIIVSPVKDEERYLESTLDSVLSQTVKPNLWVLVDDGSRDNTPKILASYASRCSWIKVVRVDRDAERRPSNAEIRAFQTGFETIQHLDYSYIVKLDCDLALPPTYFEDILARFRTDEQLGIASGVYLEKSKEGQWLPVKMPWYHASGASKVVRKECFEQIGGFTKFRIWDTADEVRAQMAGWHTRHFEDLQFRHLKYEGSGIGFMKTNALHGEIYYLCGGDPFFFLLKAAHRTITGKPFLLGGFAMIWGYLKAWSSGRGILFSEAEAKFYRRMLWGRFMGNAPQSAAPGSNGSH